MPVQRAPRRAGERFGPLFAPENALLAAANQRFIAPVQAEKHLARKPSSPPGYVLGGGISFDPPGATAVAGFVSGFL